MPETASPLLHALREGTRACHKGLEQRLPFFSEGFDLPAYRRLVEAYHGFHAPLDAALAGYQPLERRKAPALARDLRALNHTPHSIGTLPRCHALPGIDSTASALGVMYVLEGSTLGGQVLKRAMAERLGIDADSGGAFLDVYGPATGANWRAFLQRLAEASAATQTQSVDAAIATFECFEQWLDQQGVLLQPNHPL
ncbi:biliverdin-producing heme oxygenase [Pseudomonas entomophila]|uniref:Biliverdin-producing heme oxygenase n=2 Tax=Pseudomonas entomophila TaxID=312306 RepID=A0ABY9QM97_9PSED|nr:biliverdin-producing heme oxygenase [Pseudomonas entomophila]WMW04524.1 biliverdin-producing heme oxygenase [Pseudomonas entomophila]CAK14676.1 putative heme oxygenase BphO [Pseudomonas entomophila L48]